ncbi:hypothetical protein AALP_AA3G024600 [Arabis alpina]|uniref:F-box domain-containing protein n=1 Tax=Arabis alpina TaxID=50452 RepID=A0A087H6J4_ARAAL|nr:hypothetical protein AALP_AA3G024600 [Arabis alpina]
MDHLSSLPDDLRVHVLSFLTTKEAALTSVLSKKWRNLFALIPSLDFDDSVFLHPEEGKRERHGILHSFMEFVDRVLALQGDSPIKKLSIKCKTGVSPHVVNRWICKVLDRGVSELNLCLDFEDVYYLPRELFVSSTLVKLILKNDSGGNWWIGSDGTFLPMLKCLDIDSEWILCAGKIEMLLPCFPVLEEIRMSQMEWIDSDVTVSSASLRKICISATGSRSLQNPKSVSFDTPNLLSFTYSDLVAEDYPLVNMETLFEAIIALVVSPEQIKRVRAPDNDLLGHDVVLRFGNVVKLMNGIQNVERLQLHSDTLEVLSLCGESMPVFNNLKKLLITSDKDRGWQAMPVLLRNCPHLEFLLIEGLVHHVTDKCGDACDCIYRKDKGRSLRSCPVKTINIEGFRGTMKEMNMIEHFLDYFPCLKNIKIYIEENGDTELGFDLEVWELVVGMIEEFNEMYSCNVRVLMSDNLRKKWTILGQGSVLSSLLEF